MRTVNVQNHGDIVYISRVHAISRILFFCYFLQLFLSNHVTIFVISIFYLVTHFYRTRCFRIAYSRLTVNHFIDLWIRFLGTVFAKNETAILDSFCLVRNPVFPSLRMSEFRLRTPSCNSISLGPGRWTMHASLNTDRWCLSSLSCTSSWWRSSQCPTSSSSSSCPSPW